MAGRLANSVIEIVNDDMPFLVDSTTAEINRQGLTLHLIAHPIFAVERAADGSSRRSAAARAPTAAARVLDAHRGRSPCRPAAARDAGGRHRARAGDVRAAVDDWKPMIARLHEAIAELGGPGTRCRGRASGGEPRLSEWLADDHLTLLGYRQHELVQRTARTNCACARQRAGRAARDRAEETVVGELLALPAERARSRARRRRCSW
jgi:glutamate dehydrogenase